MESHEQEIILSEIQSSVKLSQQIIDKTKRLLEGKNKRLILSMPNGVSFEIAQEGSDSFSATLKRINLDDLTCKLTQQQQVNNLQVLIANESPIISISYGDTTETETTVDKASDVLLNRDKLDIVRADISGYGLFIDQGMTGTQIVIIRGKLETRLSYNGITYLRSGGI